MTIGLSVVGRPSNCGGIALLIDLLSAFPIQRELVVIGERDEKPDGKWPGRDGAISTGTKLRAALHGETVEVVGHPLRAVTDALIITDEPCLSRGKAF